MPTFDYRAVDRHGAHRSGSLEGGSADAVAMSLRAQGLFPTRVAAGRSARGAGPGARRARFRFRGGVSGRELAVFTRQLATLLRAGMPLVRSLEVLARQETAPGLQSAICDLAERLREGGSLSDAMARQGRVFDRLYVSMVRAGEAAGALDPVLARLAQFAEKSRQLPARVRTALIYPSVVLAVAVSVLAGLIVFVVPRFQHIFADLLKGAPLPPLTQAVLDLSTTVRGHWPAGAGCALAAGFAWAAFRRTETGARLADAAAWRAPLAGPLLAKAALARFARTLGTLLASGVPILPALAITRDTCGNARFAAALGRVHDRVKAGEPLARPLDESGLVPPMVSGLVDVGEQTGELPAMLGRVADIYEDDVDQAAAALGAALEPALILFLAVVVGLIVVALFLPIVRIVQLLA